MLYAAWNVVTALEEIGAAPGDLVQVIALRVRPAIDLPCGIVGEYQSIYNSGGSTINSRKVEQSISNFIFSAPEDVHKLQLYLDSFFAELLKREPKRPEDHLPNVLLAERILSGHGGLMYPSVVNAHSMNLAVPADVFDTNFEVMATFTSKIDDYHSYGIFDAQPIDRSSEFSASGDIHWQSRAKPQFSFSLQQGMRFPLEAVGWRVPVAA